MLDVDSLFDVDEVSAKKLVVLTKQGMISTRKMRFMFLPYRTK